MRRAVIDRVRFARQQFPGSGRLRKNAIKFDPGPRATAALTAFIPANSLGRLADKLDRKGSKLAKGGPFHESVGRPAIEPADTADPVSYTHLTLPTIYSV